MSIVDQTLWALSEPQRRTKAQRKAEAPVMTPKQARRHQQLNRTQELGTLKLIDETNRNTLRALYELPVSTASFLLDINDRKNKELIRLRRALISERTHRERLAAGLIPRLRSKAQECRNLRDQIDGLKEKNRIERAKARAKARNDSCPH